ncbi:MAG: polysaccharide pyruvyl transferase family protein [Planctomycetota bacterium]
MSFLERLLRQRPALTDAALEAGMAAAIEAARARHALEPEAEDHWRPGAPLKLLLVGYLGTRNTGADVRVAEMIRQLRAITGDELLELTALTSDARLSAGYFPGVRQVKLPDLYPPFLLRETARHHGVVACEGSMFKSKFANALTTLMAGALGLASVQNKLSVGYGAEAGDMDPLLEAFVARYCRESLIVCRNEASRSVLARLGVPTAPGADTAWTFEPAPPEAGRALLRRGGWDGAAPLLIVCPINPFWWPVRPEPARLLTDALRGRRHEDHYRSLYYHSYDARDRERQERYLDGLAAGALAFAREQGAAIAVVGMERLDRAACEGLRARLGPGPCLVSDEHDMFALVSALRCARWLVSSRYHAMVCSMPAGVASLGVSMDERILNLCDQRGQPELCLEVQDAELGDRVHEGLRTLERERERVVAGIRRCVVAELRAMGEMGIVFEERLLRRYPALAAEPRWRGGPRSWERYLPPLAPALEALLAAEAPPARRAPEVVP